MLYNDIIKQFNHITLVDLDKVKLQNRVDKKYEFQLSQLENLLELLKSEYDVEEIIGEIAPFYKSHYFDTKNYQNYRQHLIGKGERHKVRIRNYVSSDLYFLEVKKKHQGRTVKSRIALDEYEKSLSNKSHDFISSQLTNFNQQLTSVLEINYNRIAFTNKARTDRVTLDINLAFQHNDEKISLEQIVIAEHKQLKVSHNSYFYKCIKCLQIRNIRISKYCTGMILKHPFLKYNRFKEKLLYVNKLTNGYIERNIAA